jgi:asparagine synthase (glutamine-hydrolysing)
VSGLYGFADLSAAEPGDGPWLAADIRLDNRDELTEPLAAAGFLRKPEPSDAQILEAAYRLWGTRCVERLLGDFAFALWDQPRRLLFCARDPLGVKPFYYARTGALVVFASDARQVLRHPAVSGDLDRASLGRALLVQTEDPERTFFRDVRRLPPAHILVATPSRSEVRRYWAVDSGRRSACRDEREAAAQLREILTRSVSDRLRTEGKAVAVALSGGLDSGSVACLAQRIARPEGPRVLGFSFVFHRLASCDEQPFIAELSRAVGLETEYVEPERHAPETAGEGSGGLATAWDAAFGRLLERAAARGARVLLTGHGGDEAVSGSPRVYGDRLRRGDLTVFGEAFRLSRGMDRPRVFYRCFVEPFLPAFLDHGLRTVTRRADHSWAPEWVRPEAMEMQPPAASLNASGPKFQERARQEIHDRLTGVLDGGQALEWYDLQCARYGLEPRHPFLDRRLVEFIVSLPPELLFRLGTSKPLLRRAMEDILPGVVRQRPDKTRLDGFVEHVLRHAGRERVSAAFSAPVSAELGLLDGARLRKAYEEFLAGRRKEIAPALWYAFAVEFWLRETRFMIPNNESNRVRA